MSNPVTREEVTEARERVKAALRLLELRERLHAQAMAGHEVATHDISRPAEHDKEVKPWLH